MRSPTSAPPSWSKRMVWLQAKALMIAASKEEAAEAATAMLQGSLGDAGHHVLFEEFLEGEEISFLVISDGERVAPLVAAQDHKRIGDGDTGPNTGGMAPTPLRACR